MLYSIGCDVDRENLTFWILLYDHSTQDVQKIASKSFANTLSGFRAFWSWTRRVCTDAGLPLRCTMEATGVYYEAFALWLAQQHPEVHLSVTLPGKARKFMTAFGLRSKTDALDAYGLSVMGALRSLSRWKGIDPWWRTLRGLTRTRSQLHEHLSVLNNQRHAHRHSGIVLPEVQAAHGRLSTQLQQEIDELERRIKTHLTSRPEYAQQIACLKSIPGVGLLTIAVVLAETMGFEAFTSYSQLISFSGYDVVINESGGHKGKRKISKQGCAHIRRAMYMPANTIIRLQREPMYAYYQRLDAKSDETSMKAHVALQKKLLGYMYYLWKKHERFDPQKILDQRALTKQRVASQDSEATVDTPAILG